MWFVELETEITSPLDLTNDAVDNLVEAVIEYLDNKGVEPSVGTHRPDSRHLIVTIGVNLAQNLDQMHALRVAADMTERALSGAGINMLTLGKSTAHVSEFASA
jgi:hypothetical protein